MSNISPTNQPNPAALNGVRPNGPLNQPAAKAGERGSDRVELSRAAQDLSKAGQSSEVRQDLVARVRSEIEAGTYETPAKVDAAVHRLSEDLA